MGTAGMAWDTEATDTVFFSSPLVFSLILKYWFSTSFCKSDTDVPYWSSS
ncbi:hypothetical protein F220043C3_49870 [Enterocloster asparagiformis]